MEQIWQWGIGVIHVVQQIRSPFFDVFFKFISSLGAMFFYIFFLTPVYWCFNKKYGSRIIIIFLLSSWINSISKDFINHPRPYNLDATVKIGSTGGPGIPSGHAQQSLVVWGSMALWLKNRKFTAFAIVMIMLIAFSRVYLGVHFPTDIVGGWILGGVILSIIWPVFDKVEEKFFKFSLIASVISAIAIPSLLAMVIASKHSVMAMGAISGFCTGMILEKRYIDFKAALNLKVSITRYIIGISILIIIFMMQKILFSKGTPYYLILVFVHSWIIFLWISAGAPWLYKKFRI